MKRGWLAVCDRCGFEYHSYELQQEWTGHMVCKSCWEPRHPQDFVRAIPDNPIPPWTRPEPEDVFVSVDYGVPDCTWCSPFSQYAVPGMAKATCAIAGNNPRSMHTVTPICELLDPDFFLADEFGNFIVDEEGNLILV